MAAKKFYAVKKGKKTGIFFEWEEVKELISGFSGAEYKGFKTHKEAEEYLYGGAEQLTFCEEENENVLIAYVDGSFNNEKNIYSYGVVLISKNERGDSLICKVRLPYNGLFVANTCLVIMFMYEPQIMTIMFCLDKNSSHAF